MSPDWSDSSPEPVLVVSTGGTIDKVYFDARSNYEVGESVVGDLLRQAKVLLPFELLPLLRKDSLDITDEERAMIRDRIAARPERRVVVTHGTDTMVETAQAVAQARGGDTRLAGKTVVLTGAMVPYAFGSSDGLFNLGSALSFAQILPPGVYVAMNGQYFESDQVRKNRDTGVFERVPSP